jgi:hypothetical protein
MSQSSWTSRAHFVCAARRSHHRLRLAVRVLQGLRHALHFVRLRFRRDGEAAPEVTQQLVCAEHLLFEASQHLWHQRCTKAHSTSSREHNILSHVCRMSVPTEACHRGHARAGAATYHA